MSASTLSQGQHPYTPVTWVCAAHDETRRQELVDDASESSRVAPEKAGKRVLMQSAFVAPNEDQGPRHGPRGSYLFERTVIGCSMRVADGEKGKPEAEGGLRVERTIY